MKWYKISAKNKGILSMNALGDIYYEGNDIIPITQLSVIKNDSK